MIINKTSIIILIQLLISAAPIFSQLSDEEYLLETKCGTFKPERNQIITNRKLAEISQSNRPVLQKEQSSPTGRFLVHYDTAGYNAVGRVDLNKNGIPDFIDSVCFYFDYVHHKEVEEIGYLSPAPDNFKGGTNAFDIYVLNIGIGDINSSGLYGYTVPEDEIPGSKPTRTRYTAYIVIDNDYSSRDSSYASGNRKYRTFYDTSYTALKITAAHEYNHAVQFMYGEDVTAPSINEMTSTWFEYRLFPETKDYMQYVRVLFKNPFTYPFGKGGAITGYLYSIFGHYIYKNFGDSLLLKMWQYIGNEIQSYGALNKAFADRSTSLPDEWCKFMPWLYYTGTRAKEGYGFENSSTYPLATFYKDETFISPSFSNSEGLLSFEFRFIRLKFQPSDIHMTPDILDIILTNTDVRAAIFQSDYDMPYVLNAVDKSIPDYSRIGETNYYFKIDASKGNICYSPFLSNGTITKSICYAYPNPFIQGRNDKLFFPAPHDLPIGNMVRLNLYNSEMKNVFTSNKEVVIVDNGNRVIEIDDAEMNISTGVYIFEVGDNVSCKGKIAIIKSN